MFKNVFPNIIYQGVVPEAVNIMDTIGPELEKYWQDPKSIMTTYADKNFNTTFTVSDSGLGIPGNSIHLLPGMKDILPKITEIINLYWDQFEPNSIYKPHIEYMAANKYVESIVFNHNHDSALSGCLYLYVKGNQYMTFDSPIIKLSSNKDILDLISEENKQIKYKLCAGTILIWAGWMDHAVYTEDPTSMSSEIVRICCPIAFYIK